MFLVDLSSNLLRLCGAERISYEKAAERCKCSSKHFANIINRRTQPSLNVFENICSGFKSTPNALLNISIPEQELSFRRPMPVTNIRWVGNFPFPVCPQCDLTLERKYQAYCDGCGQCLDWNNFSTATVIK